MYRHRSLGRIVLFALIFTSLSAHRVMSAELAAPSSTHKIDVNKATAVELQTLPGVGEATAKKIIAGRPYQTVDDLRGAGVSAATLEKIRGIVVAKSPARRAEHDARPAQPAAAPSGRINLNTATAAELQELPGVGEATAKKIIAGRPYKAIDDLSKAGLSKAAIDKLKDRATVKSATTKPAQQAKVNLNSATSEALQQLPGIGEATAKKIIAGRPYKAVDDLAAAGLSRSAIDKIRDELTVKAASAARHGKVNLNTATAAELEELRGVGPATSKKIITGRPYKSVDDLAAAGVPKSTIDKIRDAVTTQTGLAVGKRTITGENIGPKDHKAVAEAEPDESTPAKTPPRPGMVWVNTDSGVFHQADSRWYGKTQEGKFMTKEEAEKAGYRESKN